jgi:hypothetical protein
MKKWLFTISEQTATTLGQKNSLPTKRKKDIELLCRGGNAPLEMQFSVNSSTVF